MDDDDTAAAALVAVARLDADALVAAGTTERTELVGRGPAAANEDGDGEANEALNAAAAAGVTAASGVRDETAEVLDVCDDVATTEAGESAAGARSDC